MTEKYQTTIRSRSYTDIIPYREYDSEPPCGKPQDISATVLRGGVQDKEAPQAAGYCTPVHNKDAGWRDGMISGNGENGVVCSCSPYSETLIYQNIYFNMPSPEPRFVPAEVTGELEEARQAVIHFDDSWNVHGRVRTYLYCFHPGHQLRLNMPKQEILQYERQTDFEKAEVSVKYTDKNGTWKRRTFTSREDNVTITQISQSDKNVKVDVVISIDNISSMRNFGRRDEVNLQYKKIVDDDCSYIAMAAHYPSYEGSELADGGYAGVTRVVVIGGKKEKIFLNEAEEKINAGAEKNPAIRITDADAVYLITKSSRTYHLGKLKDFASAGTYDILNELLSYTQGIAVKYQDTDNRFSYDLAMKPHFEKQAALFHKVLFSLGTGEDKDLYNEDLLCRQKSSSELVDAFVERAYNQGRYALICCSGFSGPRLCGLWTGEWNPGWRGAYTMDANVNIQVSGMNTGNIYDAAIGYIYFVLRQVQDWESNASMVYGMKDAVQIPVNTDGDRAVMVEYDKDYPFQYWNAGASWMLLPIFEFWQCYGNCKIPVSDAISHLYKQGSLDLEKDILLPLLVKQANFWKQLCTPAYYTDINGKACYEKEKKKLFDGEKYIIIPSYSPENKPLAYNSTITANATMDISAARDGLNMTIAMEKAVASTGYEARVLEWEELLNKLPDYKYDKSGALCEWAMNEYEENNAHRHISHLYCAWPAYETHNNTALALACKTAIENRNRENKGKDDTASHGWVHKALVAARLKNSEFVYNLLLTIMSSDIYYSSFMTDHNTDRSRDVFCTDTSFGTIGIVNEMLLYSNSGEIELFPALPQQWKTGSIKGLLARTNAEITELSWNLSKSAITASIRSNIDQSVKVACRIGNGTFTASDGVTYNNNSVIHFKKNKEIKIRINF